MTVSTSLVSSGNGLETRLTPNSSEPELQFMTSSPQGIFPDGIQEWVSPIDYRALFSKTQVLLFGDTNHAQHGVMGGFSKQMALLADAGVSVLGFEIPRGKSYLDAFEIFNATGNTESIRWVAEQTRTPVRFRRLCEASYRAGIQLYCLDMPHEERNPNWDPDSESEQRGKYMGSQIAQIAKQTKTNLPILVGYAHLVHNQIPSHLERERISYKKIGVVTAGQHDLSRFSIGFQCNPAVEAVHRCGFQNQTGYVPLNGRFNIDGFIHFPRVQLVDEASLTQNGNEKIPASPEALIPFQKATLPARPFVMRYTTLEPQCAQWEETNRRKIFEFVDTFEGLSSSQQVYLGFMLENYVRQSLSHGGGSILQIEYHPNEQAFGIDTVNSFGYAYDDRVDYAGLAQHREITLEALSRGYGFGELAVTNIADLPQTNILPNAEKKDSAYKLMLLLSTYATHRDRICFKGGVFSPSSLVIANKERSNYISEFTLEDFTLSALETQLQGITQRLMEVVEDEHRFLGAVHTISNPLSRTKSPEDAILSKLRHLCNEGEPFMKLYHLNEEYKTRVLHARSELQYLDHDSAYQFVLLSEGIVQTALNRLQTLNERSSTDSRLRDGEFGTDGQRFKVSELLEQGIHGCRTVLSELSTIKETLTPSHPYSLTEITPFSYMLRSGLQQRT